MINKQIDKNLEKKDSLVVKHKPRMKALKIMENLLLISLLVVAIWILISSFNTSEQSGIKILNFSECNNLSLEDTTICLRNYVKSFYKYQLQNDSKVMTLEEIKEEGGDCRNWAFLYKSLAEEIGFKAKTFAFYNEKIGHRFAVIYDDTGYCKIDLLNINCIEFENEK